MTQFSWWKKPRNVSVVVDNDSWVLPFAERLVDECESAGENAKLCRSHAAVGENGVAFYLGCVSITPPEILRRNHRNLVVHASNLPEGRGFSPWTYAVLEGRSGVHICLIDAADEVDSGPIVYKDEIAFKGTELVGDLRGLIGGKTLELCRRFLQEPSPPEGRPQSGAPTLYKRRGPKDSRLDADKTIAAQFDLLRVVDNDKYPAFFEYRGRRYKLKIEPHEKESLDENV